MLHFHKNNQSDLDWISLRVTHRVPIYLSKIILHI